MANEFSIPGLPSGTLYGVILNLAGQLWNTSGTPAFENRNSAHWTNYAISPNSSDGTPFLSWNLPGGVNFVGQFTLIVFQQVGGSPTLSDPNVGQCIVEWKGSAQTFLADAPQLVWDVLASAHDIANTMGAAAQSGGGGGGGIVTGYASGQAPDFLVWGNSNGAAVIAKVGLIGTNGVDSPNAITAQNTIHATLDATISSRLAEGGSVIVGGYTQGEDPGTLTWAAGTRTLTAFTFTVNTVDDANITAIKAQTDLIATNAGDSTNAIIAQTNAAEAATNAALSAVYAQQALNSANEAARPGAVMDIDLTQALDNTQLANTIGAALLAARAAGAGNIEVIGEPGTPGAILNVFASNGSTVLWSFDVSVATMRTLI